jgi:hypothetical protein
MGEYYELRSSSNRLLLLKMVEHDYDEQLEQTELFEFQIQKGFGLFTGFYLYHEQLLTIIL